MIMVDRASSEDLVEYAARRFDDTLSRSLFGAAQGYVVRDQQTPVGVALFRDNEDERFLTDLYVEPTFRGHGYGHALLREGFAEAGDRTRSALVPTGVLDAIALLAEAGIASLEPVFRISGAIPNDDALLPIAAGDYRFGTEPLDPIRHVSALAQLDRETRGTARDADHAFFVGVARGIIFRLDEEIVGYVYLHASGHIGPLVVASPAYAAQLFGYAMVALRRETGASWCTTLIPGRNLRALKAAHLAGLRIDAEMHYASDSRLCDFERYLGFHSLLF